MFKQIANLRILGFWSALAVIMLVIIYTLYWDTLREPVSCPKSKSGASAFLVLRSFDSGSNQVRAALFIPSFDSSVDSLEIAAVSAGGTRNTTNYEAVVDLSPKPTPEATPSPSPAAASNRRIREPLAASQPSPIPAVAIADNPWKSFNLTYNSRPFFYPFEHYVLDIHVDLKKKGESQVPLNLQVENRIDQAIVQKCSSGYSFQPQDQSPNAFSIVLNRHRFVQLTAVILYAVALCFLYYVASREKTGNVFANALGYLAALWGVRGIIVGPSNLFPTIIDFVTLSLYMAVTAIVLYRLLFGWKTGKTATTDET